jgi:hypothetical protein
MNQELRGALSLVPDSELKIHADMGYTGVIERWLANIAKTEFFVERYGVDLGMEVNVPPTFQSGDINQFPNHPGADTAPTPRFQDRHATDLTVFQ